MVWGSPGSVLLGHLGGSVRSEKLDPDQLQLALEAVAQSLGLTERTETLDRRPGEHIGTLFPRKHPRSAKAAPQFPLRHPNFLSKNSSKLNDIHVRFPALRTGK